MKTYWIVGIIIVIIVFFGFYQWSTMHGVRVQPTTQMGVNGSPDQTNTGQPKVNPVVRLAPHPVVGTYLAGSNNMALYTYSKDTAGVSKCTGTCAKNWPPYAAPANEPLVPGEGVKGSLSTITRADGIVQVTYNGMPLYTWTGDKVAGDVTGGKVSGWSVARP